MPEDIPKGEVPLEQVTQRLLQEMLKAATEVAMQARAAADQYGHDPAEHVAGALEFLRISVAAAWGELIDGILLTGWSLLQEEAEQTSARRGEASSPSAT